MGNLTIKSLNLDQWLSAWIAIKFARSCIHFWDAAYPEDKRPLKAIEAAEAWLENPCEETAADAAYADAAYATESGSKPWMSARVCASE